MLTELLEKLEKIKSHYTKNPNRVYSRDTNKKKKLEADTLKTQFLNHLNDKKLIYTKEQTVQALELKQKFDNIYEYLKVTIELNMGLTKVEFLKLASATINYNYNGDPLKLNSFVDSINLLESMAEDNENKALLFIFAKSKLEGKAREYIPDSCKDIPDLIKILKDKLRPESSKIVEGRMLALRADRSTLQEFSRKAEELSEAFRRALVVEGIPLKKAEELTVDKTVELCRSNTNSDLVKSVLASSSFESPKLVIAKMITELNLETKEKQILSFRSKSHFNKNKNNNGNNKYSNNNTNKKNNNWNYNKKGYNKGGYKNQNPSNNKDIRAYGPENESAPQQSSLGETNQK